MYNLFPLIILGVLAYLVLSRKGGMGCCGGHAGHEPWHGRNAGSDRRPYLHVEEGDVIDLREDQYTVLPSGSDAHPGTQGEASEEKSTWSN